MSFSLPHIPAEGNLSHVMRMDLLERVYPREVVASLLTRCHCWEERERKLSQLLMVYYVISLSLLRDLNLRAVLAYLTSAVRWLGLGLAGCLPTAAALVYRREQLGTVVLRHLFRQQCRPLATPRPQTPSASGCG